MISHLFFILLSQDSFLFFWSKSLCLSDSVCVDYYNSTQQGLCGQFLSLALQDIE